MTPTQTETAFLNVLKAWEVLFEDGIHFDKELRPYFQRQLKQMTFEELRYAGEILIVLTGDLTSILQFAAEGEMREEWALTIPSIVEDFCRVGDEMYNELQLRLN